MLRVDVERGEKGGEGSPERTDPAATPSLNTSPPKPANSGEQNPIGLCAISFLRASPACKLA